MRVQRRYDEAPHLDWLGVAVGNALLFIDPGCARSRARRSVTRVSASTADTPSCVCCVFEDRDSVVTLLYEKV